MKRTVITMITACICLVTACGLNKNSWFNENGFTISEQGNYILHTSQNDGEVDTGMVDVPFSVSISESTDDVEPGMKKVVFKLVLDTSQKTDAEISWRDIVFDRDTGAIFHSVADENGNIDFSLPRQITSDGKTFDIYYKDEPLYDYANNVYTFTETLICPESYNGAAYYVGYFDKKYLNEMMDKYSEETFTWNLGDYAGVGDHPDSQYFFSANNE
ncbi:hypothetical protein [Butyrivibrio sp. YAB3001]|uniref:hypothetical protein n=1 Tax=Butyrivibrio sp. YAB3001 TaxID=1520812 RepID=UPI001130CF67|nr:hypothetical protein [Butyrivibrio sp. YAB3001]